MATFIKFFAFSFVALLPVINPVGSALLFLSMVGTAPKSVFKSLAGRIALSTFLFLLAMDLGGAAVLKLFGISLPVVQFAGGLVLAAMGWNLLNKADPSGAQNAATQPSNPADLQGKIFYPFTFPVTAGPGVLVVMLTLSAHASKGAAMEIALSQLGVLSGMASMCVAVWIFYASAPIITSKVSSSTAHGILRVIAFVLLCIGVQIGWNGFEGLARDLLR